MKKILYCFLFTVISISYCYSQVVTEKELFTLKFKGPIDVYNFLYDSNTGKYCYSYYIEDEKKSFIISDTSFSEKFDLVNMTEILFDSKGNYYAVTANYKQDYGIDNYFLVVNGKTELGLEYIDSYTAYINKKDEYVFIFKESDLYKFGYYSIKNGLRKSEGYDLIKTLYKGSYDTFTEGEAEGYTKDYFYLDQNGERGFIALSGGKSKLIFESKEISTDYSDINESSITNNRNNELSYIAKKNGRFYESVGGEFVVSGSKEYDSFELINPPLFFNNNNEPVYSAADSLSENQYDHYLVIGNQRQKINFGNINLEEVPRLGYEVSDIKISNDGNITYFGIQEIIIPGKKTNPDGEVYDEYYSKTFVIKNGKASELGYNLSYIKYGPNGEMLYTGIADLNKKEHLLIESNGVSKIIINKKIFDEIFEYGYAPNNKIYYVGQYYEDPEKNKKYEVNLYLGNKLIGKYDGLVYQVFGKNSSILKFDSKNNYAFVAEDRIDSISNISYIITNSDKLPFPTTSASSENKFNLISNLMFTKNDKLFYIGEMKNRNEYVRELYYDNKSLGKVYNMTGDVNYNESTDEISFFAARENKIYKVTVQF